MNILITGGRGFLGRRVAVQFSALGHSVLPLSRQQLDITHEAAVLAWFREYRPQVVLHCTAISDTGICQQDPGGTEFTGLRRCAPGYPDGRLSGRIHGCYLCRYQNQPLPRLANCL